MERQMKLVALILAQVSKATSTGHIPIPEFEGYRRCEVLYHVQLCEEAGFLDIRVNASDKTPVSIVRMTWAGHEKLDEIRNLID